MNAEKVHFAFGLFETTAQGRLAWGSSRYICVSGYVEYEPSLLSRNIQCRFGLRVEWAVNEKLD